MVDKSSSSSFFRCSVSIPIRYADIDAQRHVNNVAYFTFMEQARVIYMSQTGLWQVDNFDSIGMVVAEACCSYLAPAYLGETVTVWIRIRYLGTKSFHFAYLLETERGKIATGRSVQVCYDYTKQQSISVPLDWRQVIIAYETVPVAVDQADAAI
ncbi:MAG: acyl-CoA thioesterase [Anaerolineales bacterium]|nr:acyl-CoA thioesterase [Anaerolineales bacterium]